MEPEVTFAAAKVQKIGPKTYSLTDGWFTTCMQTPPRWEIVGSQGTITLDERVLLKNAVFRVKGVPLLYLPMIYYPLGEDDRSTGFLLPTYSALEHHGPGHQQRVLLGDQPEPGRDVLLRLVLEVRAGRGSRLPIRLGAGVRGNAQFLHAEREDPVCRRRHRGSPGADGPTTSGGAMSQQLGRRYRLFGRRELLHRRLDAAALPAEPLRFFATRSEHSAQRCRAISASADCRRSSTSGTSIRPTTRRAHRQPAASSISYLNKRNFRIGSARVYLGRQCRNLRHRAANRRGRPTHERSLWRFDAGPNVSVHADQHCLSLGARGGVLAHHAVDRHVRIPLTGDCRTVHQSIAVRSSAPMWRGRVVRSSRRRTTATPKASST